MKDFLKSSGLKPVPLVVFCGARGSGKDTAAKALSWPRTAFATNPKRVAGLLYGLGGFFLEDAGKDDPIVGTITEAGYALPQEWKDQRTTSRQVVRTVAEGLKDLTGNRSIWAMSWLNWCYVKACQEKTPFVLTDMRFPEEIAVVRPLNPTVIHIVGRGDRDSHVSDVPVEIKPGDYVIHNTRDIRYLHDRVKQCVINAYGAIKL